MALSVIDRFGHYSVICVNWGKSIVFPLHPGLDPLPSNAELLRVSQLKYLGVEIHRDLKKFVSSYSSKSSGSGQLDQDVSTT